MLRFYKNSASVDPEGSSKGSYQVVRGGSWNYGAEYCRSANRGYFSPSVHGSNIGFRLVRQIK